MGCSRGGTTLTQRLVAERLGLYTLPETRFFASMIGNTEARMFPATARPLPGLKRLTSRLREAMGRATGQQYKDVDILSAPRGQKWAPIARVSADFVAGLDRLAQEARATGWLEKTPFHLLYARDIQRLVPGAWMVHIQRDARETIASLWDVACRHPQSWGMNYDRIERAVDNWNASTAASAAMVGQPRQIFIPYAALAARPEAVMEIVAAQIRPEAPTGSSPIKAPVGLANTRESWKADALSGAVKPAASKWMTALDGPTRARAEPLIAPIPDSLTQAMAAFAPLIPEVAS